MQRTQDSQTPYEDKYGLIKKYGPFLSMEDMSEFFDRSEGSLRSAICHGKDNFSVALRKIKKRIGRRNYFKSIDVEKMIDKL